MNSEIRNCQNCKQDFVIESDDFNFYEKMKVPPPTFCPECRIVRRMVARNEHFLYRANNGKTGKPIFSMFPSVSGMNAWSHDEWLADDWDRCASGRDYDFSRPFFEQYSELLKSAPVPCKSINQNIESEYSNNSSYIKNCYLCFGLTYSENLMYVGNSTKCTDCVNCSFLTDCSLCYGCFFSQKCSRSRSSSYCQDCFDVAFCYDCVGCSNCVGCVGLKKKSFYILNQAYSKEDYFKKVDALGLDSREKTEAFNKEVARLRLGFPLKYARNYKIENCVGEYITNSKNVQQGYYINGGENLKYCQFLYTASAKDSYDHYRFGTNSELMYEASACGDHVSRIMFCYGCFNNCSDLQYSHLSNRSSHLFGCVGLYGKNYCILNKQYTKEEYEALVLKIIEHMDNMPYIDSRGRVYKYGEFFPPEISPFAYNETIAQEFFPLTEKEVIEKGFKWREPERYEYSPTLTPEGLPDSIKDANESITKEVIKCMHDRKCNDSCTGAFKITAAEFNFYKQRGVPLPVMCPNCRYVDILLQRSLTHLYRRQCCCAGASSSNKAYNNLGKHSHGGSPCPNEFETPYIPDRPEIIYCEQCYQQETA